MTATVLYAGRISGAAIATAIGTHSGSYIVPIYSAGGQEVVIIKTDY